MNRILSPMLALALASAGCVTLDANVFGPKEPPRPVREAEAPPPPPVTATQINDKNAAQKLRELTEELDYEELAPAKSVPAKSAPAKNT